MGQSSVSLISLKMKLLLLVISIGAFHASYIGNDVCKTEYSEICEEVEKPHVELKTERKCNTIFNQQCRNEQKPVVSTEFKSECRTQYDEVCSSTPRTECSAVQMTYPTPFMTGMLRWSMI